MQENVVDPSCHNNNIKVERVLTEGVEYIIFDLVNRGAWDALATLGMCSHCEYTTLWHFTRILDQWPTSESCWIAKIFRRRCIAYAGALRKYAANERSLQTVKLCKWNQRGCHWILLWTCSVLQQKAHDLLLGDCLLVVLGLQCPASMLLGQAATTPVGVVCTIASCIATCTAPERWQSISVV